MTLFAIFFIADPAITFCTSRFLPLPAPPASSSVPLLGLPEDLLGLIFWLCRGLEARFLRRVRKPIPGYTRLSNDSANDSDGRFLHYDGY